MRQKISTRSFGAAPPSTSAATNTTSAPTKVLRVPKLCTIHAESSMAIVVPANAPVESHCARSWPMPNAPMMSGIATTTDVVVTDADIVPSRTVMATSQR